MLARQAISARKGTYLESCLRGVTRCQPRVAGNRLHGDSSAPVRSQRQKKQMGPAAKMSRHRAAAEAD